MFLEADFELTELTEPKNSSRKRPSPFSASQSAKRPFSDTRKSTTTTKALPTLSDIYSSLDQHISDGFRTARDAVEDVVISLEGEINQISSLKEKVKTQELTIAAYKRRYGSLDSPFPDTKNAKLPATPSPVTENAGQPVSISHIAMRSFENVPQRSNSGFMQEKKSRRVEYDGKWNEERVIMEELQQYKAPGRFHGTAEIGGRTFTIFQHQGGDFKYLDMPSPRTDSIVTADGGRKVCKIYLPISVSVAIRGSQR